MNIYVMKAAMKSRPYLVNQYPLPPGYWRDFYSGVGTKTPWVPPTVRVERKSGRLGDVLGWIGGVPLFSAEAVELLIGIAGQDVSFAKFGEILSRPYWVLARVVIVSVNDSRAFETVGPIFGRQDQESREILVKEIVPASVVSKGLTGFEFRTYGRSHLRELADGKDVNVYPGVVP